VTDGIARRLERLDWEAIERGLWERGYAKASEVLRPAECEGVVALYADDARFRSTIDMGPRRFGVGEYRYFAYPLPPLVEALRLSIYPRLAPIANGWMKTLGDRARYPADLRRFLARCRRAGQTKPTPLLLSYEAGGYNCLHRDLYGPLAFPLQIAIALSRRGADYTGGEFLLVEQRPRAQSVGHAVSLEQGEMIVFTNHLRPVRSARAALVSVRGGTGGHFRAAVRHGVSPLLSGRRYTLGIIFHDAE
jgi:uncharacterized protein